MPATSWGCIRRPVLYGVLRCGAPYPSAGRVLHLRRFGLHVEDPPPCARPNSGDVSCVSTAGAADAAVLPVRAPATVYFWAIFVERRRSRVLSLEERERESVGKGTGSSSNSVCRYYTDEKHGIVSLGPVYRQSCCTPGVNALTWRICMHIGTRENNTSV